MLQSGNYSGQKKKDEITTMIYKALHRNLKIEQRNVTFATIFNDIFFYYNMNGLHF